MARQPKKTKLGELIGAWLEEKQEAPLRLWMDVEFPLRPQCWIEIVLTEEGETTPVRRTLVAETLDRQSWDELRPILRIYEFQSQPGGQKECLARIAFLWVLAVDSGRKFFELPEFSRRDPEQDYSLDVEASVEHLRHLLNGPSTTISKMVALWKSTVPLLPNSFPGDAEDGKWRTYQFIPPRSVKSGEAEGGAEETKADAPGPAFELAFANGTWRVVFDGKFVGHFTNKLGWFYIALCLADPGERLDPVEMVELAVKEGRITGKKRKAAECNIAYARGERQDFTERVERIQQNKDDAKRDYKARLVELDEAEGEAERRDDEKMARKIANEKHMLCKELKGFKKETTVGKRFAECDMRLIQQVFANIKNIKKLLMPEHPVLVEDLERVKRVEGRFVYRPSAKRTAVWQVKS
jgi:hypothetical protein